MLIMENDMHYVRRAEERGLTEFGGWLSSRHSFSFGGYYDAEHMGFSALRVINDDRVAPGAGFDAHGHRDMEIISYVLDGALHHEDSAGNHHVVSAGEVQIMSAGAGIVHAEYNHSDEDPVRFLQIWIEPDVRGSAPGYGQDVIAQNGALTPLVTADGRDGTLSMRQKATLSRLMLDAGETVMLPEAENAYLHVIEGSLELEDTVLDAGDALGLTAFAGGEVSARDTLHALYFELPT